MKPLRAPVCAAVIMSLLAQSGCYDWEMVRPTEVPKLNGSFATPIGQSGNATVVAVRVADVEREDGTLVRIRGDYDLRVELKDGTAMTFSNPVRTESSGDDLLVRGGNRAETRIPLKDIAHASVSQLAPGKTAALTIVLTLVAAGATVGITLAAANSH
jgi:hypothetical protein